MRKSRIVNTDHIIIEINKMDRYKNLQRLYSAKLIHFATLVFIDVTAAIQSKKKDK